MGTPRISPPWSAPWLLLALWLFLLSTVVSAQRQQPGNASADLAAELARAVDLGSAKERRAAALALSKRKGVGLPDWLAAMQAFGHFEAVEPGVMRERVPLVVGKATEETELFVYVPPGYDPQKPAPLLLMGHGSGGNGRGQHRMWRGVADELGMLVLSPSEAVSHEGYAFTERERQSALAALRWARRRFNVDENRIYGSGISRGGHLAWDLAVRFPDLFAAIAPMIGGPRFNIAVGQNNIRYLENIARLPIRDLQGARDDPRLLFNLRLAFRRLEGFGASDAKLIEFPELGHSFDMAAVDWKEFLGGIIRDPRPKRVVRACAVKTERRAFWVEVVAWPSAVKVNFRPKVKAGEWERLDDAGRRELVQRLTDERTARAVVDYRGPGDFVAKTTRANRLRLVLTEDMLGEKNRVAVVFNGKTKRKTARPTARVLLLEFVERFDRSYLPVAEVTVP